MRVRFQADADLSLIIVSALVQREPAVDFRTAAAAELSGLKDPRVLAIAAEGGRMLVTHDRKSMPHHFAEFIAVHTSAGVLIVPQGMPVSRVVDDLLLIWTASEAEEWTNCLLSLPF